MDFNDFFPFILKYEGGYVNHPADKGGATNFGITQKTYDNYLSRLTQKLPFISKDVKDITQPEVKEIYYGFWKAAFCDKITVTHPLTAFIHFDFAINSGPTQAARTFQHVIGAEPVDGILGRISFSTLFPQDDYTVANKYLDARILFYKHLIEKDPSQEVFRKNWMKRIELLRKEINDKSKSIARENSDSSSSRFKCITCGQPIPPKRIQ